MTVVFTSFVLIGESGSHLCSASFEDFSAVGSFHSLSETVLHFSLTLFGLIGSEHINTSSRKISTMTA